MSVHFTWLASSVMALSALTVVAATRQAIGKRKGQRRSRLMRPFSMGLVFGTRFVKSKRFLELGARIVEDVQDMVGEPSQANAEARVLIPLVADIRRRGDRLIASKTKVNGFVFARLEKRVSLLHTELMTLEKILRALPRSKLTLEDVLAGKFENSSVNEGR